MRRVCLLIAMAVVGVLLVPGVAGSAAKRKHKVDVTIKAASVGSSGGVNTVAGEVVGKPLGQGAVVYKSHPEGGNIASTFTTFAKRGTFRGTALTTPSPQPDGSTSFTGTLQVTGGTARYRGAKGKDLGLTGTLKNGIFTFRITGTVRY